MSIFYNGRLLSPKILGSIVEKLNQDNVTLSFVGLDWLFLRLSMDGPLVRRLLLLMFQDSNSHSIATLLGFLFPYLVGYCRLLRNILMLRSQFDRLLQISPVLCISFEDDSDQWKTGHCGSLYPIVLAVSPTGFWKQGRGNMVTETLEGAFILLRDVHMS